MITFTKATKLQAKLRLALKGPSGSGKTFSALAIGSQFGSKIAVLDTEYGSASKYSDKFAFDRHDVQGGYHSDVFLESIRGAGQAGYEVFICDSMSHFWNGAGGLLERVTAESKRFGGNSHAAWGVVTPIYNTLIDAIMSSPMHVIICLRAKQDYVQEKDDRGKTVVKKIGMGAEIREGFEYALDIEGLLDMDHNLVVGKTRCDAVDGKVFHKPGKDFADPVKAWLSDGAPVPIDWKSLARSAYLKAPKEQADAIRAECGDDFEAMTKKLEALVNV